MASSIKSRASAGEAPAPRRPAARTTHYLEPRLERAPRPEMTRLQTRRLREQVSHAATHSPFYRRKLGAAGVKPAAVRTLDDLRTLPFTTKDELKENQAAKPPWGDLLAVPLDDVLRVHMTSATTGRPVAFLDTKDDWYGFYHSYARALHAFGVRRSDMVMAAFSYGPWIGYWSGFYAAQDLGCLVFPVGGLSTDQRIDALLNYPITVLGCTPSYALFLGEAAAKKGVDLAKDTKIRITWHTGEPGELVFTSLYRKAMPLLRYRTREVVQVADRRCPCGRTLVAFEGGVLARLDDMKKIRGVIVSPRRVEELVRPHADVDEFQIVFRRREGLDD